MDLDILNLIDRIRDRWENRSGLIFATILLFAIYFAIISFFCLWNKGVSSLWINLVIPIILLVCLFIFWVIDTNRFFINLGDKISAGITVHVDNDRDSLIVNKIVRKVIDQINHDDEFSNLDLKLLPTNFCVHDKQVNQYHKNFSFMYDLIIRITVESGRFQSIEKIIITKLSVTFRPKSRFTQKKVFFNVIDLTEDMNLQVKSRDWEYLMQNDGIDKVKYLGNIYHIILYNIGFYAIYSDRYADAMKVMTPIYDAKKTRLKLTKDESNRLTFQLTPYNIA